MIDEFKTYLDKTNLSENSKSAYLFAFRQFTEQYHTVTKKNLNQYKVWLVNRSNSVDNVVVSDVVGEVHTK